MKNKLPFKFSIRLKRLLFYQKIKLMSLALLMVLSVLSLSSYAQDKTITGKVTNVAGESLPGVTVSVKGSVIGTTTNNMGVYTLAGVSDDAVLSFSFVGMTPLEVSVDGRSTINVVLEEDVLGIEQVVVVGYGSQKKANMTAAVTQINTEKLGSITTNSIGAALQGQMPGLFVRDAGYNQGLSYLIRGVTTIGSNSPLFVVDGIPQNSNNIDPNDIETISILKDGAAAAIYGARAAAGVVLITTKSGQKGKAVFNYETYTSWSDLTTTVEVMGSANSARIMNEASINSGGVELFTPAEIALFEAGTDPYYPNTIWTDEVLKTERSNRHYLSASGGNENTSYLFSLGYKSNDGIMNGIDRKHYTLRSNIKSQLNSFIEVTANLSYSATDNMSPSVNGGMDNIYLHMSSTAPFLPVYMKEEDGGGFAYMNQAGGYQRGFWNALWELQGGSRNDLSNQFVANTGIKINILDGLSFVGRYSGVMSNGKTTSYIYRRSFSQGPAWFSDVNSLYKSFSDSRQLNAQNFLSYDKQFGDHSINAMAGWDVQFYQGSWLSGGRRAFQFDTLITELNAPNSGDKDDINNLGSNTSESALQSGVGRINYGYAGKYLVEFTGRYDGSSVFAPETRYGFFPSVSAGWVVSNEDFFGGDLFDYLKLRASYGSSGNNSVAGSYYSSIAFGTYYFGAGDIVGSTASEGGIPFRGLRWESTNSANLGLEFSILGKTLSGEIDVYNKVTNDILLSSPVQGVVGTGRSGPAINAGTVKNTGVELILTHAKNVSDKFSYSVSLNGTYNKNEIVELTDAFSEYSTSYRVGDPIGAIYGYQSDGILSSDDEVAQYMSEITSGLHPNTSKGDIKYVDANGDKSLDFMDRVLLGETIPRITYGLRLQANYGNFDLIAFVQGVGMAQQNKATDLFGNYSWIPPEAEDRWTEDNPDGTYPRPLLFAQQTYMQNFYTTSDYWMFSGAYLRVKNIQLGYTFKLKESSIIKSARIYASTINPITISDFRPGFDPEQGGLYIPPLKTYSLGLNVKF